MQLQNDGADISIKQAAPTLKITQREIEIGSSREREFDFQKEVERMRNQEEARRRSAGGLRIDGVGFGADFLDNLSAANPVERLLAEAQALTRDEKLDEAIAKLDELLTLDAACHEAIYLKGYCQSSLGDGSEEVERALRTVRPLQGVRLEESLRSRLDVLLEGLRERRMPELFVSFTLHAGNPRKLLPVLEKEVALDPGFGFTQFLLAGALVSSERPDDAVRAIDRAMPLMGREDRARLQKVRDNAVSKLAEAALAPARELYRQGKFAQAQTALSNVQTYRDSQLFLTLEAYLRDLAGPPTGFWGSLFKSKQVRTPDSVTPTGTAAALDELGFFLVREDLDITRKLMAGEKRTKAQVADAERRALEAVGHAPWFPFVRYICAQCLQAKLFADIDSDPPPLEEVEQTLEEVRRHLLAAANDTELKGVADALDFVKKLMDQVAETKKVRAAQEAEIKKVTAVLAEFKATMEFVGQGIKDPDHYRAVRKRLEALNAKVPQLERETNNEDCREAIAQLKEVLKNHLAKLRKMSADVEESERIAKLFKSFKDKMEHLGKHPISSHWEKEEAQQFFTSLNDEATAARARTKGEEAKKALDHLLTQLGQVLSMLRR